MIAPIPLSSGSRLSDESKPVEIRLVVEIRMPEWMQPPRPSQPAESPTKESPPVQVLTHHHSQLPIDIVPEITTTRSESPTAPSDPLPKPTTEPTLSQLYRDKLLAVETGKNAPTTIRQDLRFVSEFEQWVTDTRNTVPRVGMSIFQRFPDILKEYAAWFREKPKGNGEDMCNKSLSAIRKLCKVAVKSGMLAAVPERPTVGDIMLMTSDQDMEDAEDIQGIPVTIEEFRILWNAIPNCGLVWPRLGKVPPETFWQLVLLASIVYGFRTQDWFAARDTTKNGLTWAGIIDDTLCPRIDDLHCQAGWVWYLVHKTKKKDVRKKRSPKVLMPLHSEVRRLIELFRGIHPEFVFPLPCNSHSWSREFNRIKKHCGLDDATRLADGKSIIRLSEGKKAIASFRKGSATLWANHVSESAASYVLKHTTAESGDVSAITRAHYLQRYRPLMQITPAIETLPLW